MSVASLIAADEPPAFATVSAGQRPVVFVCDHASNRIPAALGTLGLDPRHLEDHIAWDIGAAAVALQLIEWFGARGVLGGYSRLVVDLNRSLHDSSAFVKLSDGVLVPANVAMSAEDRAARAESLYWPYHDAVGHVLDAAAPSDEESPVMIAIHSFTPRIHGVERPWHIGVLWDKDPRVPLPLLEALRGSGIVAGDNEPYSGRHPADFTIDHHAEPRGIAHVGIEIRQDLIRDEAGQARWAARLAETLDGVLADPGLYRPRFTAHAS